MAAPVESDDLETDAPTSEMFKMRGEAGGGANVGEGGGLGGGADGESGGGGGGLGGGADGGSGGGGGAGGTGHALATASSTD